MEGDDMGHGREQRPIGSYDSDGADEARRPSGAAREAYRRAGVAAVQRMVAGPTLAECVVARGVTDGEDHREAPEAGETTAEAGKEISGSLDETLEEADGAEEMDTGGKAGLRAAERIALAPHVLDLVKQRKWREAISYIASTFHPSDVLSIVKLAATHLGMELEFVAQASRLARFAGKVVLYGGGPIDVIGELVQFQFDGLKALAKAHEEGRRDNRIYLYVDAWAHAFLYGEYHNSSVVSPEQREAVEQGIRDGQASVAACGEHGQEIGRQLLDAYKSEDNARRALEDALLERAGIHGIKLHEGR
jgi:hypothetical protein